MTVIVVIIVILLLAAGGIAATVFIMKGKLQLYAKTKYEWGKGFDNKTAIVVIIIVLLIAAGTSLQLYQYLSWKIIKNCKQLMDVTGHTYCYEDYVWFNWFNDHSIWCNPRYYIVHSAQHNASITDLGSIGIFIT